MNESQNTEFKESWHDEYLKWICGFANAKGGKLLIGVDDAGKPVGVANAKKLMEDIPNKIRDTMGIVADVSRNPRGLLPKFYSAVGCFVVTLPNLNVSVAMGDTQSDAETQKREGRAGAESGQSQGRVGAESGDIKGRIVTVLRTGELSKAEIAAAIGLGRVSGYLNRAVRALLADGIIELTLKDKPASRLQKYRLVDKGE